MARPRKNTEQTEAAEATEAVEPTEEPQEAPEVPEEPTVPMVTVVAVHPFWFNGTKHPRETIIDIPEPMAVNLHRNGVAMRARG